MLAAGKFVGSMMFRFILEAVTTFENSCPKAGRPCQESIITVFRRHLRPQSGPQIFKSKPLNSERTFSLSGRHPPMNDTSARYFADSDPVSGAGECNNGSPPSGTHFILRAPMVRRPSTVDLL